MDTHSKMCTLLLIIVSICVGGLSSCTNNEPIQIEYTKDVSVNKTNPHSITLAKAIKIADSVLNEINPQTRSRVLEKVEFIKSDKTRSINSLERPDTILYLINYANEQGFALIAADDRLLPIYAISDKGQLNQEDFNDNPGLLLFKQQMEEDIDNRLLSTREYTVIVDWKDNTTVNVNMAGPLLSIEQRKWNQYYPFNYSCPYYAPGYKYPAGCVPVAVGSIMAYHEWPLEYEDRTFRWDYINLDVLGSNRASSVIQQISKEENLATEYIEWGDPYSGINHASQTDYHNVKRTLLNMGYTSVVDFEAARMTRITTYLNNNCPILARAKGTHPEKPNEEVGHMWVIDGFLQIMKRAIDGRLIPDSNWPMMYHCVWGWRNSLANGYFAWTTADGIGGMPIYLDENDPELPLHEDETEENTNRYVFKNEFMCMYVFKPNKE